MDAIDDGDDADDGGGSAAASARMAPVTDWAGIESGGTPPPRRAVVAAARLGGSRRSSRLRRLDRTVAGSIDEGAHLLQQHGRLLVLGTAAFVVPIVALNLWATVLAYDRFDDFDDAVPALPEFAGAGSGATGVEDVLAVLAFVATGLGAAYVGGYCAAFLVHREFGVLTARRVMATTLRRLPALTIAWLAGHALTLLLVWVAVGGASVGWAALAVLVAYVMSSLTLFVSPVIVTEQVGPRRGLQRALRLAQARYGEALAFVALTTLVGAAVRFGIAYLPRTLTWIGLVTFGDVGWLVEGIAGQVGQLVSVPLVGIASARYYLEVRMHAEGLDIAIEADRVFAARRVDAS
jgi:hypothetical protein